MKITFDYYLNIFLKIVAWTWLLAIAYLSLMPQVNIPISFNHVDKIFHLGAYAVATLFVLISYSNNNINIILLFLYSLSMEIGQLFVKNRFFEISDLIANLAGILIMAYIFNRFLRSYLTINNIKK